MPTVERVRTAEIVFLVGVGGFAGASLRHVVSLTVPGLGGTFAVNIAGCLILGALAYEAELVGFVAEETYYAAATGFCSSFTTYSTFALELVRSPALVSAGYVVSTYAVGFAAVLVGRRTVRTLTGGVES
jgi:CrcB protein